VLLNQARGAPGFEEGGKGQLGGGLGGREGIEDFGGMVGKKFAVTFEASRARRDGFEEWIRARAVYPGVTVASSAARARRCSAGGTGVSGTWPSPRSA